MLISAASSHYVGALSISLYVVTSPILGISHLSITRYASLVHYSVHSFVQYSVCLSCPILGAFICPILGVSLLSITRSSISNTRCNSFVQYSVCLTCPLLGHLFPLLGHLFPLLGHHYLQPFCPVSVNPIFETIYTAAFYNVFW